MSESHPMDHQEALERELGLQIVQRLHGLIRATRLYDESNQSLQRQLQDFVPLLSALREEELALVGMGDNFYVNGLRLRAQASQVPLFRSLLEEFESHGLGALRFLPGLTSRECAAFLRLLVAARTPEQAERLPEDAAAAGILRIVPVRAASCATWRRPRGRGRDPRRHRRAARARQTFTRTLSGTRNLLTRTARTGRPALRQAKRIVQPVVDGIMKNEYSILGMVALKDHDEYTYAHCLNVSILSVGWATSSASIARRSPTSGSPPCCTTWARSASRRMSSTTPERCLPRSGGRSAAIRWRA